MSDKNRRMILSILKDGELNVNQILLKLSIGQATLSSHLRILKKAGLVDSKISGKLRIYHLEKNTLNNLLTDIQRLVTDNKVLIGDEIIIRRKNA